MNPGEPSNTAKRVAAHRLTFDRVVAPYGNPAADLRLASDVSDGMVVDSTTKMASYLRARTAFFDEIVVGSIALGATQIVAVGAGYDARSLRYAAPGVAWFELDHPDTQRDKIDRLNRLSIDAAAVTFIAADFRDDGLGVLARNAGCDPARRTLFVCEGVASYLAVDVLGHLLGELRAIGPLGSSLAISFAVQTPTRGATEGRIRFEAAVASLGETIQNRLAGAEAAAVLADAGWRAADPSGGRDGARRHLAGLVVAEAA